MYGRQSVCLRFLSRHRIADNAPKVFTVGIVTIATNFVVGSVVDVDDVDAVAVALERRHGHGLGVRVNGEQPARAR